MSERELLKRELYWAFLESALAMGKDLKQLSWFGRNHKKPMAIAEKKAA